MLQNRSNGSCYQPGELRLLGTCIYCGYCGYKVWPTHYHTRTYPCTLHNNSSSHYYCPVHDNMVVSGTTHTVRETKACEHEKTSEHQYCEHDKTSLHFPN